MLCLVSLSHAMRPMDDGQMGDLQQMRTRSRWCVYCLHAMPEYKMTHASRICSKNETHFFFRARRRPWAEQLLCAVGIVVLSRSTAFLWLMPCPFGDAWLPRGGRGENEGKTRQCMRRGSYITMKDAATRIRDDILVCFTLKKEHNVRGKKARRDLSIFRVRFPHLHVRVRRRVRAPGTRPWNRLWWRRHAWLESTTAHQTI